MEEVIVKVNRVLHIIALLIASTTSLYSQKEGASPLATSAMQHLYPRPEKWSGARYTTSRSFVDRLYLVGGTSLSQVWRYDRDLNSYENGINTRVGLGVDLAPVHTIEIGTTFNNLNRGAHYNSVDASYLFNLSNYGERTEDILPFEVQLRGGAEYSFGEHESAQILAGLKLKYNITPTMGLFLEPGLGICVYSAYDSLYKAGDICSSVMLGFTTNIGGIVSASQRTMARNSSYWDENELSNRKTLLSIKSNLLYDMALIPNIEMEFAIKNNYSIGAQVMCGWWLKNNNTRCWQVQAADIEARYWFGDRSKHRALTGWFAGLFASAGLYDFQLNDTKGMQGEFYVITGVSGGYAMPIGRRMNLEFAAGVGYVVNDYQKYNVYENEYLVADGPTMRFQSVFPAKVEVSLGWLMFKRGEKRSESRREYKLSREEGAR